MKSALFDLFASVLVGYSPCLYVLVFFPDPKIEVRFNRTHYLLRIVSFFGEEVVDVVGNVLYFFAGTGFDFFIVLCLFEESIDKDLDLVIVLLPFLLGKGASPVENRLRHHNVVQFIVIVVFFEQLLLLLEGLDFDFALKLIPDQLNQFIVPLDFVILEEVVDLQENILLLGLSPQEWQS